MGVGTGWRRDDYAVMDADFDNRGAVLDSMIDALHATWAGKAIDGADDPDGPEPYSEGGPPIVLGGASGRALRRAGERGAIRQTISALEDIGVDEVCLWPRAHGIDQLHELAAVLGT